MSQAIATKYLSPTNTKGGRIKATCEAGSITIDFRHDLGAQLTHRVAAMALAKKIGWDNGEWHMGGLKDCYVFVRA